MMEIEEFVFKNYKKLLFFLTTPLFLFILLSIYLLNATKKDLEYFHRMKISGVVTNINRIPRGTVYTVNNKHFQIPTVGFPNKITIIGDSIFKGPNNDTVLLFRKKKKSNQYYLYGKFYN